MRRAAIASGLLLATGCARSIPALVEAATLPAVVVTDPAVDTEPTHADHRPVAGRSTVLLLRDYDPGNPLSLDDERFVKVSIVLPSPFPESGRLALGPGSDVRVVRGGSAWPRDACQSLAAAGGTLRWSPSWRGGFDVELDLLAAGTTGPRDCATRDARLHWQGHVPRRTLAQLTPFQGRVAPGAHIYDETYP